MLRGREVRYHRRVMGMRGASLGDGRAGWLAEYRRAIAAARVTEALRAVDRLIEIDSGSPAWALERMRIHARARDWAPAIDGARRVLAAVPRSASVWMELGNLLAGAGRLGEVAEVVERAVELAPGMEAYRLEAARLYADIGEFGAARAHAAKAAELGAAGHVWLGRMALWSGDHRAANERAAAANAREPGLSPALTLRAAVELVEGRVGEARALAEAALAGDPMDAEASAIRGETALLMGQPDIAEDDLDRALENADGYALAATMLRLLRAADSRNDRPVFGVAPIQEVREAIEELVPGSERLGERSPAEVRAVLMDGLARMHGNRSTISTYIGGDGALRRIRSRTSPRHASRRALELIRAAPAARAVAEMDEVVARYPDSSLPICHRAELHLWLGVVVKARADFDAAIAINRATRFAWIGLAGVALLEGEPQEAVDTLAEGVRALNNTEGPAVFVYRGEALRRMGRAAEARADLERAVALRPSRIGAWINLALARYDTGDLSGARAAAAHVRGVAAALWEDAAEEALGRAARNDDRDIARTLAHALVMLRGNRSSTCLTYFTRDGELRALERRRTGGTP